MGRALAGVRVVDLTTGVAGPMASMMLADFGADVIKVEPPGGDPGRSRPGFAMWNRNKPSVALDLGRGSGRGRLRRLLEAADMCVAGDVGGPLRAAGAAADQATRRNPRLVYLSVPPYLDQAPWAGGMEANALLSAAMGASSRQSSWDGGPVDPVYPHLLYIQAIWAACAAVAALIERARSGHGQSVTVGGVHGALVAMPLQSAIDPAQPEADTAVGPGGPSPMYSRYLCADGRWLFLAALTQKFQHTALDVLGVSDLLAGEPIAGNLEALLRPANRREIRSRFVAAFKAKTCDEWLRSFRDAGCPVAALADREAWLDHPQIRAIGMSATLDDPGRGRITMPGNPVVLTATPACVTRPAPQLGPLNQGLPDWPALPSAAARRPQPPPRARGPLAGVRVLDLGAILAGPYAGTLLAELGADVVKVEVPAGDTWRQRGFVYIRGQRGLAIDLRAHAGRTAFYRLVSTADIVVDNYRPGVLRRLAADYDSLRRVKPDVISLSITAFGEGGPLGTEAGFDPLLQAMSGVMTAQGGDGEPVLLTLAINDIATAALCAFAACVALYHRKRTGNGQRGWISLAGAAALVQCEELIRMRGRAAPGRGGRDFRGPGLADRFYRTADGWIRVRAVSGTAKAALRKLVAARYPDAGKTGQAAGLEEALARFFSRRSSRQAASDLAGIGVPAAPARRITDVTRDPALRRWEAFHEIGTESGVTLLATGRLARFSRTPNTATLVPPGVGEHSAQVLREAGLDARTIRCLLETHVIRQGKPMTLQPAAAYR